MIASDPQVKESVLLGAAAAALVLVGAALFAWTYASEKQECERAVQRELRSYLARRHLRGYAETVCRSGVIYRAGARVLLDF